MKCGTYVKWELKGKKKPKLVPTRYVSRYHREVEGWKVPEDYKLCDGKIIATVEAEDEPFFGGCSASLEITYKCDKCKMTAFSELPTDSKSLSEFLTRQIQRIDQDEINNMIGEEKIAYKKHQRAQEEMVKKMALRSKR